MTKAIVTMPPYAPHLEEVVRHGVVSGIRLNTVMPVKDSLEEMLSKLNETTTKHGKDLWIDLKYRQLRVKTFGVPPFTEIELTQKIEVDTPCKAYFSDGKESATLLEVNGNKLIMKEGPKRVVGPGESINLPYNSLKIEGGLTEKDKEYIKAAKEIGLHNYMLSFVESSEDIELLRQHDDKANIVAKIESKKGIKYVRDEWDEESGVRLMAARGDLYMELKWPHEIIAAVEGIVQKDPDAIVASRIFDSLAYSLNPDCQDINDADNLMRMGYETLMLGDHVCLERDSVISALNLLNMMAERYEEK